MSGEGRLGPAKHRQAEAAVGEPLLLAIAVRHPVVECVTPDDRHYLWDRLTGAVQLDPDPLHWTTCPRPGGLDA